MDIQLDSNSNEQKPRMAEIYRLIPQRPPFLFIDKINSKTNEMIETEYYVTGKEHFFQGHFPQNPVMPGVLLCEACFQSGAALLKDLMDNDGLGVVTKIEQTRFKTMVKPGDLLNIQVNLIDSLNNAYYLKGKMTVKGKTALQIKFQVASIVS